MIKEPKLTYNQLRQILCLAISNSTIKAKLEDLLSGKLTKVSEVELLELISTSEADKELIRILSGQDPDNMDAVEALEYISAFFAYIRASKEKCKDWLGSFGLAVTSNPKPTDTHSRSSR
ncbi:MAG: hypothetical protein CVU48_09060 [Candidatus Cloacimonetes bacterium HGW-Cloacimonetes-1]|jgi:hypothetical protein|nr:MAG: hypothetical protein CVU48_09060 [Candidatus Cloacimonetes bacterium HGW-Cloacimonetes-1]